MLTQDTGSDDADFTHTRFVGSNAFVSRFLSVSRAVTQENPHQPTPPYPLLRMQQPQRSDEEEELNILIAYRKSLLLH